MTKKHNRFLLFNFFQKTFFVLAIFFLIFTLTSNKKVHAVSSDSNNASYKETSITKQINTDYTDFKMIEGQTTYQNSNYNQRIHVFFQKQTKNSKIVTWAVKSNAGKFARCNVSAIAKDYEAYHPGWKVVGAINADQYTTGFGTNIGAAGKDYYYPQPYYSMICDNEGWFVIGGLPVGGGQNILGFLQDDNNLLIHGSANLKSGDLKLSGMYLYILDEYGNRTDKFFVNKINETPRELETTIWTSCYNEKEEYPNITVNGNLYVVERAERAYMNNSIDYQYKGNDAFNSFFGKGTITKEAKEATFGYGAFAIDTKDENLNNLLKKGVKVLVQYELEGEFSKVESAIGYHTIHRLNDQDIPSSGSYNTNKYTRSIVGKTKDGKIFLMAVDQTKYSGMNWEEICATLKYYNVVEAYQMDGGGSTTSVIKENGSFVVTNSPRDGSPRNVFSALLLVEREEIVSTIKFRSTVYVNFVKRKTKEEK